MVTVVDKIRTKRDKSLVILVIVPLTDHLAVSSPYGFNLHE